jgi:hypothetical protein
LARFIKFMLTEIFPGGRLPSTKMMVEHGEKAGFEVPETMSLRNHYIKTLGLWADALERKTAAEFSFFLAVPTMAGATVYSLYRDRALLSADDMEMIAIGFFVAFLVALAVVKAFVAIVARHGFAPFAWYRIVVGTAALAWLSMR